MSGSVRKYETPVAGGLQFQDLPPEVLVDILGRVSPKAREATTVSRYMNRLADAALMTNILRNNLADPTIGLPEREKYFKLTPEGRGIYTPEPGLWRAVQQFTHREEWYMPGPDTISDRTRDEEYMTIWNFINDLQDRRAPVFVYCDLPMSEYFIHEEKFSRYLVRIVEDLKTQPGDNVPIKFVALATIPRYDLEDQAIIKPLLEKLRDNPWRVEGFYLDPQIISIQIFQFRGEGRMNLRNIFSVHTSVNMFMGQEPVWDHEYELSDVIKFFDTLAALNGSYGEQFPVEVQILHGNDQDWWARKDVPIRIVVLNKHELMAREIIFPVLQDDVYHV